MNLFDRLPAELFRPLTGTNRRQTWTLLVRLYERFFGPEALPPQEDGFLQRDMTMEIERFLLECNDWQDEDGESLEPILAVRANVLLHRLVETGWLSEDRIGVRNFISMHPVVTRFLETLHQFAVEGPQLIGGKVQMIYNQLMQVMAQPESQASGFQSAAHEAVQLINTLNTIAVRVRDLFASLGKNHSTEVFVRRFFLEYISQLYVRDYRQLRTENHPLKHRWEIVSMVQTLRDEPSKRTPLLKGYAALPRSQHEDPAAMFEADVARFMKFVDIERYLDRLDHTVNEATKRSIAFISYRLKTSDRLELLIEQCIETVLTADTQGRTIKGSIIPPGPALSEERLRAPKVRAKPQPRVAIRKRAMTPRERAFFFLRRAMAQHRDVTAAALERYLVTNMEERPSIISAELKIDSVEDACAYLLLSRLALLKLAAHGRRAPSHPLLRRISVDVEFAVGERTVTPLLDGPQFVVHRRS